MMVMQQPKAQLIAHCGARYVDEDELRGVPCPRATRSFQPVGHANMFDIVRNSLDDHGFEIAEARHALTKEGGRYFGAISLTSKLVGDTACLAVGIRNAIDKSMVAGLAIGERVFVCDNMSFSGDHVFKRKHTTNILRDLRALTDGVIEQMPAFAHHAERRIERMQQYELDDMQAHDAIIKLFDAGAIKAVEIESVLDAWRNPEHAEFVPRNAWSLFNAVTQVARDRIMVKNPGVGSQRTIVLNRIMHDVTADRRLT